MDLEFRLKSLRDLAAYSISNNKIIVFSESKECSEKLKKILQNERREIEITEVFKYNSDKPENNSSSSSNIHNPENPENSTNKNKYDCSSIKNENQITPDPDIKNNEIKNKEIINYIKILYEYSDDEYEKNLFKKLLLKRNVII